VILIDAMAKYYSTSFKFFYACVSMLSMFAGAQVVHSIYEPLSPLEEEIKRQKELIRAERAAAKLESSTVNAQ